MNNSRRRMVVQKFNNRPPFDMKSKEASTGKNHKKSFEHIEKSFRTIMNHLDAIQDDDDLIDQPQTKALLSNIQNMARPRMDTNYTNSKSPVPKVLESFLKATPKKSPVVRNNPRRTVVARTEPKLKRTICGSSCSEFTLQTLYRNKNIGIGKNVHPAHKMMKNLLEEFEEPKKTELTPVADEHCLSLSVKKSASIKRLDKSTSTTDMPWEDRRTKPLEDLRQRSRKRPAHKLKTTQKFKSKIPARQSEELISKQSPMNSSKEGPFLENKIISSPSYVCSNCEGNGTFVLEDEMQENKFSKSFVSSHVKLNKSFINNKSLTDNTQTNHRCNQSLVKKSDNKLNKMKKKSVSNSKIKVKNISSSNYMGMINTVKNKYPKLEVNNEHTTTDWSDEPAEPEVSNQVKFPKETRAAMERLMENPKIQELTRKPLNKYIKTNEELIIQPAISFNRVDVNSIGSTKVSYTRKTSPYTICKKLEPIPGSKESGIIGDHVRPNVNSAKVIPYNGRTNSYSVRKVQKPRGVR